MLIITFIEILLVIVLLLVYGLLAFSDYITQKMCEHDEGVRETRSCDAICVKCRKNLGFIGKEENKKRKRV